MAFGKTDRETFGLSRQPTLGVVGDRPLKYRVLSILENFGRAHPGSRKGAWRVLAREPSPIPLLAYEHADGALYMSTMGVS